MNYQDFIKPELLILIPVLYFVGAGIKRSNAKDEYIPLILGAVGVVFAGVYVLASEQVNCLQGIATAIFTAFTQGVLCAGASVYVNQIFKQAEKAKGIENDG